MRHTLAHRAVLVSALVGIASFAGCSGASADTVHPDFPAPATDEPLASTHAERTAVFSGGCFWGMQLVFEHVKGVTGVEAGYAGGSASTADYESVSSGTTGHAESVRVTYDPSRVTYGQLLEVFFAAAHDPTERNRQGPDVGTQYRSMISYTSASQQRIARAYIAQLDAAKVFPRPIATEVKPLHGFYAAEAYHQDYAVTHPESAYIVYNDLPKLPRFQQALPALYSETRVAYQPAAADAAQ